MDANPHREITGFHSSCKLLFRIKTLLFKISCNNSKTAALYVCRLKPDKLIEYTDMLSNKEKQMNSKHKTGIKTALMLTLGVMIAGSAIAEKARRCDKGGQNCRRNRQEREERGGRRDKDCPWAAERAEFGKAQHEKISKFRESHREKMKAAREAGAKEEDPHKIVAMMKANHTEFGSEAKEFFGGIQSENEEFMNSMFAKYKVPEEEQSGIRDHIASRRDRMRKKHEARYNKIGRTIDELAAKDDLTKEDIKNAMRRGNGRGRSRGDRSRNRNRRRQGKGMQRGGDGEFRGMQSRNGECRGMQRGDGECRGRRGMQRGDCDRQGGCMQRGDGVDDLQQ
jgi:hypothetical protein